MRKWLHTAKPTERRKDRGRRRELLASPSVSSGKYEARTRDGGMEGWRDGGAIE